MGIKISFITPCLNEQEWLPRLLSSLNNCNFLSDQVEFIVADNGSTDRTINVLWDLIPQLKYPVKLVHEFKKGVSNARNSGARIARGEFLVFIDADNILTQNFVDQLWKVHQKQNFYGATIRTLAEPGSLKGSFLFYLLEVIKMVLPTPFGKSVARKEAFFSVGGFDNDVKLGENVSFTSRLKCNARRKKMKFLHITSPIYCSLRRFDKVGYLKILYPWMKAYLGNYNLPYETVDSL
jgi:glycosyltransferase involved in cell wall biosynthesis